jgi:PAS domain S-box-containing protein
MKNMNDRHFRDYAMTILIVVAVLVVIASAYIHAIQALLPIAALLLALHIYLVSKDGNIRWLSGVLAFGFVMSTLSNICWYLVPALGFNDLVSWYYYYYVTGIFWMIGYIAIAYVLLQMIYSRQWYLERKIDRMITVVAVLAIFMTGIFVFFNLSWDSKHLIDIFVLLAYLCIDIIIVFTTLKMALAVRGELRYLALSIMVFFGINAIGDLLFEARWLFKLSNLMTVNLARVELSFHFRDLIDITYNISLLIVTGLLFVFVLDPFARRTLDEMRGRLKDTQLFVDDLIAKSPDATCIFDRNGQLMLINDRFLQVFGLKRSDIDRSFNIFGHLGTRLFPDDTIEDILKVRDRETVIIPKLKLAGIAGGRQGDFYIYLKMFPTYGSDGRLVNYVLIVEDITERVRLEDDLFRAYNSLKEEYARKTDFTNAAAHELRTPLTPIIGYTDILKAEVKDERHRGFLEIIERNALRQKTLVNRMLELAGLDAGMAHVNNVELALRPLILEIADNYRAINAHIRVEVPEGLLIDTDPDILRHVLDNLVSNAVKYSDNDKEVEIRVAEAGDSYQFSVKDHGAGIPKEEWGKIFERFYIVGGDSDSRTSGRSGLGLALVKAYISLIGGSVWLESEPGKGSTFFFTVPKAPSASRQSG